MGDSPTLESGESREGREGRNRGEGGPKRAGDGDDPTRIGRFTVIQRIGAGGMGVVYAAFDPKLDRKIAVKLVRRRGDDRDSKADAQARLLREAQAMAKLSHPNVISVFDVGTHDGQVYIAMEFVDGSTLDAWHKAQPRTEREVLDAFVDAGRGLAAAHAAGMVHRDFKPENVLVGADGRVRVMDFGIVRADMSNEGQTGRFEALSVTQLEAELAPFTEQGALLGTPAYMAPEQITSSAVDARADQFSFCVSLYEALYGERPFAGNSVGALLFGIMQGKIREPPKGSRVSARLRRILLRGLSRKATDRYPSMEPLLADLARDPARARRRLIGSVAVGMASVGAIWGYSSFATDEGRTCRSGADAIDEVWNDERAEEVRAAFAATDLPFAGPTFESIDRILDARTEAWRLSFEDACDATHERQDQSGELLRLRLECLDHRRAEQQALINELVIADPKVVERAVTATANLIDLARCSDMTRLRNQVPPPDDVQTASRARELRGKLAEVRAKSSAGKYAEALALAQETLEAAEDLAYRPLIAEALHEVGTMQGRRAQYEEARTSLERAFWLSMAVGHDEQMAVSAVELVHVVGTRMGRPEDALVWAKHAMAGMERLGELGRMRESAVLHARAAVLRQTGRYAEARADLERSLEIREKFREPGHVSLAASLNNLGNTAANMGDLDEAQRYFGRALEIFIEQLGEEHPMVAAGLNNMGQLLLLQGKYVEARQPVERSLQVWQKTIGPDHPNLAHPLNSLGLIQARLGEFDPATTTLTRALELNENAFGPDHPQLSGTHANLAAVLELAGRPAEARPHIEAAIGPTEKRFGPESLDAAQAHALHGRILLGLGELEDAKVATDTAVRLLEAAKDVEEYERASPYLERGLVRLARGELELAITDLERALASARENPDRRVLAEAREAMARALLAKDPRSSRGRTLATDAREQYATRGVGTKRDLRRVDALLAAE